MINMAIHGQSNSLIHSTMEILNLWSLISLG